MEQELIELIDACKRDDPSAQRAVYRQFSASLFAVALRYSNTKADAEDIIQESWIKIFRFIKSFSENNSFVGWLRRIVVNTAITHYRRNQKYGHHLEIDEIYATPGELEAFKDLEFTKSELEQAICQLPPGYGMVFKLYVIEGFRHREIAEQLGIDLNTSKSQLSRARRFLQGVLADMSKRAKEIDYE